MTCQLFFWSQAYRRSYNYRSSLSFFVVQEQSNKQKKHWCDLNNQKLTVGPTFYGSFRPESTVWSNRVHDIWRHQLNVPYLHIFTVKMGMWRQKRVGKLLIIIIMKSIALETGILDHYKMVMIIFILHLQKVNPKSFPVADIKVLFSTVSNKA